MALGKHRAVIHWVLGLATLVATAVLWPGLGQAERIGSLVILIALVRILDVEPSLSPIGFLPVTASVAYLSVGRDQGLTAVVLGLLIGGTARLLMHRPRPDRWIERIGQELGPLVGNGLSVLVAATVYQALGSPLPLLILNDLADLSPVLVSLAAYLLAYNLLCLAELWLGGGSPWGVFKDRYRAILATQILPLPLAPLSALILNSLGLIAFFLLLSVVLVVVIAFRYLMSAQHALQNQIQQLRSFSGVSRALRSSLEIDALLDNIYVQFVSVFRIKNLHIVLTDGDDLSALRLAFGVRGGKRERDVDAYQVDDLTKWVLRERLPLLAEPVGPTAQRLKLVKLPTARTWLGVPLLGSDRLLGCIYTWLGPDEQPERHFTAQDQELLGTIAAHSSVALENALLYQKSLQHVAQLGRLNEISALMNTSLNPERVFELVSSSVIEVAGCDKAAIYLLEDSPGTEPKLALAHARGFSKEHLVRSKEIALPLSSRERWLVMQEGTPVVVNIADPDSEVPGAMLLMAQREGFQTYVYLPLRAQNRAIGILAVYYIQPHRFAEDELRILETFANQAALAVMNARVYQRVDEELTRRVGQIVKLANIGRRISSTLDRRLVFDLIIESAMEGCGADAGLLVLSESMESGLEASDLVLAAWRGYGSGQAIRPPQQVVEELVKAGVLESGETVLKTASEGASLGRPLSQLIVPVLLEGRAIGAIVLESEHQQAFSDDDITFVEQMASQAAVAIRNAQLYEHTQLVRDRLHAILDSSSDGLLMIDARLRIVMTNTRMGAFWDFARQDFGPPSPEQFMNDPLTVLGEGLGYRKGELNALIERVAAPDSQPETDLYVTRPVAGQRQRFVERTAVAVRDENGNFLGLLLVFRDVTTEKELEQARQDLITMIVHDLRAPLQSVTSGMRLIEDLLLDREGPVGQALQISNRAVRKLLNLINNLLDLSRLESGEMIIDATHEDVNSIVQDAVRELAPLAQEVNVTVQVDTSSDLPVSLCDRDMIERVVLNLLDNALKYTPPGSTVRLSTGRRLEAGREMICVQVADSGEGVPDEYKEMIFERFVQIPGKKGHRRSAGLGLAFCKLAVEAHGGRIWVEDNPNGGSAFNFTLPIAVFGDGHGEKSSSAQLADDRPRKVGKRLRKPVSGSA